MTDGSFVRSHRMERMPGHCPEEHEEESSKGCHWILWDMISDVRSGPMSLILGPNPISENIPSLLVFFPAIKSLPINALGRGLPTSLAAGRWLLAPESRGVVVVVVSGPRRIGRFRTNRRGGLREAFRFSLSWFSRFGSSPPRGQARPGYPGSEDCSVAASESLVTTRVSGGWSGATWYPFSEGGFSDLRAKGGSWNGVSFVAWRGRMREDPRGRTPQ